MNLTHREKESLIDGTPVRGLTFVDTQDSEVGKKTLVVCSAEDGQLYGFYYSDTGEDEPTETFAVYPQIVPSTVYFRVH